MKYLMTTSMKEQDLGQMPPQALMDAMEKHVAKAFADGTCLSTGGLAPMAQSKRIVLEGGKVSVTDGPFAEAKEVVGGYAIMEATSPEHAVEMCQEFVDLHLKYWPGIELNCEIRQIFGPE